MLKQNNTYFFIFNIDSNVINYILFKNSIQMEMKKIVFTLTVIFIGNLTLAQQYAPKIIKDSLYSKSLENPGGENPTRSVTIYLPPGYDENTDKRYPVVYYLHGFTMSDQINLRNFETEKKLEFGFEKNKIRPFILVVSDQHTLYKGSFYTNSSLTGNWADFTAKDLVNYMDNNYRTIPERDSRGICGWSMGGRGTIKMGMEYPDVFSAAYALSPSVLTLCVDWTANNPGFKAIPNLKSRDALIESDMFDAFANIAFGRAVSPNPDNPPFYTDMPFTWEGDSLIRNYDALKKWYENMPYDMLDFYAENFSKLKAFKIDWGKHDQWPHIPVAGRMFSEKLEALGIEHYAEEYIGNHWNKIWSYDGRMVNSVLPFFNANLKFQEE
jgi:enterochelin esterase-like enzyme